MKCLWIIPVLASLLGGCVNTQTQPDGSTKVKISVAEALGIKPAEPSAKAPNPAPAPGKAADAADKPKEPKAWRSLALILSCANTFDKDFDAVESALKQYGWSAENSGVVVKLPNPVKVFGLSTQKIVYGRYGGEDSFKSYFPGVSQQEVIKAASLKLSKDGKQYIRQAKQGIGLLVLTVSSNAGETVLECAQYWE